MQTVSLASVLTNAQISQVTKLLNAMLRQEIEERECRRTLEELFSKWDVASKGFDPAYLSYYVIYSITPKVLADQNRVINN